MSFELCDSRGGCNRWYMEYKLHETSSLSIDRRVHRRRQDIIQGACKVYTWTQFTLKSFAKVYVGGCLKEEGAWLSSDKMECGMYVK